MESIDEFIDNNKEALTGLFEKFGINAEVNKDNLTNAMAALPMLSNTMANTFEGFNGFNSSGDSNDDEYESVQGKDVKDAKRAKRKANLTKLIGTGKAIIAKAKEVKANKNAGTGSAPVNTPAPEELTKKDAPKVMGINAYIFWSVIVIIVLIIAFILVKTLKK